MGGAIIEHHLHTLSAATPTKKQKQVRGVGEKGEFEVFTTELSSRGKNGQPKEGLLNQNPNKSALHTSTGAPIRAPEFAASLKPFSMDV